MKTKLSVALVFIVFNTLSAYTTLNFHDVYPLYNTRYHFNLMNEEQKEIIKEFDGKNIRERIGISASFVGQKATYARNLDKVKVLAGDVHGRLNMVGLTYGSIPTGQTQPALLTTAAGQTFTTVAGAGLDDATYSDLNQNFGFFSLPTKYRKIGARFNIAIRFLDSCVFSMQGGVVDMKQTITAYTDKTSQAAAADVFHTTGSGSVSSGDQTIVEQYLMDQRTAIFTQMGIDAQDWNKAGAEDISFCLAFRHNISVNKHHEEGKEWTRFIITPHARVASTFALGKKQDPDTLLSLPFGNNGHHAVHANAGISLDFIDSIEVACEGGATHFFDRTYRTRVPTHRLQSVLFPYKTDVTVKPGKTWHMSIAMNAHHFIDKLSMYAEYTYLNHGRNSVALVTADSAFVPSRLEDDSNYKVQMAHIGFNYDLSPNVTLGFLWQAPLAQRGTYKSNTLMFSGTILF